MKTILKILLLSSLVALLAFSFSCEKKNQKQIAVDQAEGKIIATFNRCYGYWVMIEVENPPGIGDTGSFTPPGDSEIKYKNAIGVPYFNRLPDVKTGAKDSIGTWLNFKYRKLTDEERHSLIFVDTAFHGICPANIIPPTAQMYIITKVIDYH